jgi:hypothetical protein
MAPVVLTLLAGADAGTKGGPNGSQCRIDRARARRSLAAVVRAGPEWFGSRQEPLRVAPDGGARHGTNANTGAALSDVGSLAK